MPPERHVDGMRPHTGVDHDEVDGVGELPHAGGGNRGGLPDVVRRHIVREIDHARLGAGLVDDCVADADPRVAHTEVRGEADDALHDASSKTADPCAML
jgi:hypothetical protein